MKKLFALLAVALGVVACQKDQADFGVNLGGEQEVTINVALSAETRASSALGSLDNDVLKSHDLRYTLEIYQGDHCLRMEKFTTEDNVAFPVRLAPGREYKFAVWADFVKKEGEDAHKDLYYTTSLGLKRITLNKAGAMDEARDAFYGKATLAATANLASLSTIELTRPFAKVRVVATDIEDVRKFGIEPDGATVTYTVALPTTFNAVEGVAGNAEDFTNIPISYNIAEDAYSDAKGQLTVLADYIFVPESGTISFNLDVKDGNASIKENNFSTAIPVERNKVTSIVGAVLTNSGDINVEVKPDFGGNKEWPDANNDAEKLAYAAMFGGEVTLTEDVALTQSLNIVEGANVVLNLNDHNIIIDNDSEELGEGDGIIVYGNLTIEGKGTVEANTRAIWARGTTGAKVTINGGHFIGSKYGSEVIYASGNGQIEINGGKFEAVKRDEVSFAAPQYAVLNLHGNGKTGCDIVVKGGSFKNFDPANNVSENPKHNFCAEGYVSVANGELFDVVEGAAVASKDELNAAFTNNEVDTVALNADITYNNTDTAIIEKDFTIAGNGNAITAGGAKDLTPSVAVMGEYDVNINNTDVIGGFIGAYFGANVTVNGGSLKFMDGQSGRNCFYSVSNNDKQSVITINNVDVNMANASGNSYLCAHGNAVIYVTGGKFYGKPAGSSHAYVKEDTLAGYTGEVIITGGEFNFDPSEWVAAGYVATQNGNVWTVSKQ